MSILRMMLREIASRKLNFALALGAVSVAVGVFVYLVASSNISRHETRKLMLKLGFNLLILPKSVDFNEYWGTPTEAQKHDMPEDYVVRLSKMKEVVADHFMAKLEQWSGWRDQPVLLTGLRKELGVEGRKQKKALLDPVPTGEAFLGYQVALRTGARKGEAIKLLGSPLKVSRILKEKGSRDDSRIYLNLKDMQALTKKPGRINAIQALGCKCKSGSVLKSIRKLLAERLPEVQVFEVDSKAVTRAEARAREDRQNAVLFPVIFVVSGLWIGVLFFLNVRQRSQEIGVLRAVGVGVGRIAFLFLGKALLVGLLGALVGFGLGALLTYELGQYVYHFADVRMKFILPILPWCFGVAPAVALLAGALPTLHAVMLDPALVLREE